MVVEARVRLRHRGCYSQELPPGVQLMYLTGDRAQCIGTIKGPPGTDFDAVVLALARRLEKPPRILSRGESTVAIQCLCTPGDHVPRLSDLGATTLWPAVLEREHEWWHLLAPSRAVMEAVLAALAKEGDLQVEHLGAPSPDELGVSLPLGELTRTLSAKQLAALRLAIHEGYYGTPRRVTLDDLAKALGLSRSTYQEHLQKAEEAVMERFGGVLVDHPVVAAAAARRAGRPRKVR